MRKGTVEQHEIFADGNSGADDMPLIDTQIHRQIATHYSEGATMPRLSWALSRKPKYINKSILYIYYDISILYIVSLVPKCLLKPQTVHIPVKISQSLSGPSFPTSV